MLVELLGLPGSGKSTLVKTLLEKSSDHPIDIETLTNVPKAFCNTIKRNVDIFGERGDADGFSRRLNLRIATQKYSESYLKMQSYSRTEI
jgi:ABC-type multidrug transport system ATPase subunit